MATTEAENRELVRNLVEDVFNDGQLARMEEFYAEDYVGHNPVAPEEIHGPAEWRGLMAQVRKAFPDFAVTIDELLAENDKVVQRSRQSGTHEGEFMGIEPTGKSVETEGIVIYQIEDGKIVEEWVQDDMLGLMQQLGVVEPPGQ